jgi:hypothetical protein
MDPIIIGEGSMSFIMMRSICGVERVEIKCIDMMLS